MLWAAWLVAAAAAASRGMATAAQVATPTAPVATASTADGKSFVELAWGAVPGATGYWLQEWSREQIIAGWYQNRTIGQHWLFQYNYGGIALPACGFGRLHPDRSVIIRGRPGLLLQWRVRAAEVAVGSGGADIVLRLSNWSSASNELVMPGRALDSAALLAAAPAPPNLCCQPGQRSASALLPEDCTACAIGRYAGRGAVRCDACAAGRFDDDREASSPCR